MNLDTSLQMQFPNHHMLQHAGTMLALALPPSTSSTSCKASLQDDGTASTWHCSGLLPRPFVPGILLRDASIALWWLLVLKRKPSALESHHITSHIITCTPRACNAGAEPDDFGLPSKAQVSEGWAERGRTHGNHESNYLGLFLCCWRHSLAPLCLSSFSFLR